MGAARDDLGWRHAFSDSGGDTTTEDEDEDEDEDGRAGDGRRHHVVSAAPVRAGSAATTTTTMDGAMHALASVPAPVDAAVDASVYVGRIGPELRELRAAQGADAERYTATHYDRLYGCDTPWNRDSRGGKTWCKDVHGPGCTECTSCHFCRQKTTDVKTTCACGSWRRAPEGGRGRGSWCGWCLEMRIGENVDEALADEEWRCPVCRDICNCSGANCLRAKRNLFPTQQLTHEALTYGWPSVAHYLITTAIVSGRDAPPMLNLPVAFQERRRRRQQGGNGAGGGGTLAARGTISGLFGAQSAKEARAAALRAKVAERVRAAFGELVDQDDDEEDDADGDDEGELLEDGDIGAGGARGGGYRSGARRGGSRRAHRRGARAGTAAGGDAGRDGYESSDGSELNSSDSESDLEEDATTANANAAAPNADRAVDIDEHDRDREHDDVIIAPRRFGAGDTAHARPRATAGPSTSMGHAAASRRPATGETNGHRQPKQKRARTTYGGDGRPNEVWSDDDIDDVDVRVVRSDGAQTRVERSVAELSFEDDVDVAASQMQPATSANGGGGSAARAPLDADGDHDDAHCRPHRVVVRRRRRRRRLPRPDDAREFAVVNPDVVVDAQNRAERASAQEDHEEARAAEGSGACATILRDIRSASAGVVVGIVVDDVAYRDALVRSNASIGASTTETDSGVTVDEGELRAFCALVVRIVRERSSVAKSTHSAESLIADARETLADAERFRLHDSAARAIILRALLRCTDHAMFHALHASEAMTQLLTLMAELGQEYCLIRDNMRSGAAGAEAPPPLPEHIQARVAELNADLDDGDGAGDADGGADGLSVDDRIAMLLLERLEASHVLLYATMAALRRSARGPPVAGREALFCPTFAAFLSPTFPFKIKLRKQALRLVAAVVTAAARDWGDPKSAETRALAVNLSECMWPALHDLLAMDYPARGATEASTMVSTAGGSGVGRAVIETSARSIALLLRAGVWGWGKAEAAIVAPHTPATFWRGAGAPYRALALRLYARLLDATPVLYAGVGAPLLKLWTLATMDPSGGGAAARGLARARARLTRAAKRHAVLFAAFPSSEALRGCERSDVTTTIMVRAGWVCEALRHAATTSAAPQARVAAIAAANAFWDALPALEAEARGTSAEGSFAAASAMVLSTCASHLAEALKTTPTMVPMVRKIVQLSSTRGARGCETRASTLTRLFLAIAAVFDARDAIMLTTLVAALHEAVERPSDDVDVIWRALDKRDALQAELGISSEKIAALKEYILIQCAKRSIERVRYSAASASAMQSAKGWCHALASLAKTAGDDIEWFTTLMPAFLDAMQPPAVPVGKGAAPPPISIAPGGTRAAMFATLADVVKHHPNLIANVQGDVETTDANAANIFFVAVARAAITEVAHALGGAEESKGYAPLSEADRNAAGRRLRASLGAAASVPTPRALEEAYRGFIAPAETDKPNIATDANLATPASTAIAALKFLSAFASATPAATQLVKAHVLSPIKAAMKRKETHARRMLVPHVHGLWAAVGLIQHSSKENMVPTMMDSAPPTPAKPAIVLPRMPWPQGADAPCAFASIANVPKGTSVNVIGQLVRRDPKRGVVAKVNPKTGKSFDMAFFTLSDHAGDELRVQLIGKSAKACAAALDVDGMPSELMMGFIGLAGQSAKGTTAMAWDPKSEAEFILNPEFGGL